MIEPFVTNRYVYGPYGEPLSQDISLERQGFIGKERDLESGLADHGVRKYDYISGSLRALTRCGRNNLLLPWIPAYAGMTAKYMDSSLRSE